MNKRSLIAGLLSAFIWPGAGQLYNRDYRRGFVFIGLTIFFVISLFIGIGDQLKELIPPGATHLDFDSARQLSLRLTEQKSGSFRTFNFLMSLTWAYSIIDAFMSARKEEPPPEPPPSESGDR
ncbi:MAG TPA: hypothetical protein PK876_00370 [Elusimicrobiota bacterium]|nr:hypothetical protein [Elusimicrobiota bacterium]